MADPPGPSQCSGTSSEGMEGAWRERNLERLYPSSQLEVVILTIICIYTYIYREYIIIIYNIYIYMYGAYWSYDFRDHTIASASFRLVGDGSTHFLRKQCEV